MNGPIKQRYSLMVLKYTLYIGAAKVLFFLYNVLLHELTA